MAGFSVTLKRAAIGLRRCSSSNATPDLSSAIKNFFLLRFSRKILLLCGLSLAFPHFALPQFSRIIGLPANPEPEPPSELAPDKADHVPRTNIPPLDKTYISARDRQESENGIYHLRGNAVLEQTDAVLKADEIDYNEETGDAEARGHVFYQNFTQNEKITCDRVEYNLDTERGKFYNVHGTVKTHIDARPGMLTSNNPFYFEAKWAERIEEKYILHEGLITGCTLPNPWWTLRGPRFDIIPEKRALAYNSWFFVRKMPLFYTPFFYKSLEKEPRQSGFLTPNIGHSSLRGFIFGVGYFWAINRSYDLTYLFQDWSARGYAHHMDFRGKPNDKTDFNVIAYGVQDRGIEQNGALQKFPGYDVTGTLRSDLGDGWTVRANLDLLSSLAFREQFTDSFNEAIFSSSTSTAWVGKHFGAYSFDVAAQRVQLYEDATPGNFVILHRLPEVDFTSRDQQISDTVLPLWVSFDSSAGLLHRSDPTEDFRNSATVEETAYSTGPAMPRIDADPRIMTALHWGGITLTPSFALHETYFGQSFANDLQTSGTVETNAVTQSGIDRFAEEAGVDITFPAIERIYNRKTFLGDKLKHVVETRATYKYVAGVTDFNRLIRFDTTELLNDTNQIEFSVTNRLYAKRGDTVSEVLTWEVAQQRYFDPTFGGALVAGQRNVTLDSLELTAYAFLSGPRNYSPISSNLRFNPLLGVSVIWQADYDPLRGGLIDSGITADFHHKIYFVSAGNNYVRGILLPSSTGTLIPQNQNYISPPANQLRGEVGLGNNTRRGWNGAVTGVYDYRAAALNLAPLQFLIAQITYNTDCCGISGQYRLYDIGTGPTLRHDNEYRVAFTIANVGQFGNMRKQERIF